jgi:hypothetical protein
MYGRLLDQLRREGVDEMGGGVGAWGRATVVERSLGRALATTVSAVPPAVPVAQCVPTLSWDALPVGQEGSLPTAVVTWLGHPRVVPVSGTAAGPAEAASTGATATDADADAALAETAAARDGIPFPGPVPRSADDASAAAVVQEIGPVTALDLSTLPMGGVLVDVLAGVAVADISDAGLLDVAARWQEVVSWATAMQSRALGEIGRRRAWTEEHTAAAAEISARLRVPQGEANKHLARGGGLAEHPEVLDALHEGVIDTAKADILLRSGNPLTTEERAEAIKRYLPQAPDHTRRWLRDRMNEFANGLKGTVETTKHAMTRRAVFLDPADNSMAWLSANLPATDAAAVWDAVEQAAHALRRAPGGTRTLAQARADALVAITTGRIIVPRAPECAPAPEAGPAAGPTTAKPADGSATGTLAAAESGAVGPGAPALPRTTVPATGCTCGGCTCGGTAVRLVPVKPQIRVTIAATTLLGLDNAPGHLDGYGPIPADVAARIATDATWQRLLTDPATGILADYSTTTYQPGMVLRQAVIARDQTCSFLQCDRPARWADLDHIEPFDHTLDPSTLPPGAPGQTRAANLQPLCRAHHLAKTHHGWTPVRDAATGITTWTAPTGHVYTRPATRTGQEGAQEGQTGLVGQTGEVSNDITSLTGDTRARLGQPPRGSLTTSHPTGGENTQQPATEQPATDRPTTEQQLRRFPDQPPF